MKRFIDTVKVKQDFIDVVKQKAFEGKTISGIARELGITKQAAYLFLHKVKKRKRVKAYTLKRWCDYLGVDVKDYVEE